MIRSKNTHRSWKKICRVRAAILLSDDPGRLFLVQAALARDGRAKDFLFLDTQSLNSPAYFRFLHKKFPRKWPDLVGAKESRPVNPIGLIGVLTMLAKTNELYYLHPSFGYYFEQFYLEPHGLVYKLKTLPEDSLLPPLPDKNQIAGNEAFWSRAETQAFAPIDRAVTPPDPNAPRSWGEQLLKNFTCPANTNQNAILAGTFYSRSLDFWGVQLQRANELEKAAAAFTLAQRTQSRQRRRANQSPVQPKPPCRQERAGGSGHGHPRPIWQISRLERSAQRQRTVRRTEFLPGGRHH